MQLGGVRVLPRQSPPPKAPADGVQGCFVPFSRFDRLTSAAQILTLMVQLRKGAKSAFPSARWSIIIRQGTEPCTFSSNEPVDLPA